jgi:hypothetical protein
MVNKLALLKNTKSQNLLYLHNKLRYLGEILRLAFLHILYMYIPNVNYFFKTKFQK